MQGASFDLYTGMNLPMVISYVNASLLAIEVTMLGISRKYCESQRIAAKCCSR